MEYRRSRRRLLGELGGIGALALGGCLGRGDDRERLHVASPWSPDSLDPTVGGSVLRRIGITETLVAADYDAEVAPGLATDWSTNDDATVWEFELREGVAFHDGSAFDADTAVASLRRAFGTTALAGVPVERIDPLDDHRIEIETEVPFVPLPAHLNRPETALLSPGSFDDDRVDEPVGTGPFAFEEWDAGSSIDAVRNEAYHGTVPEIDGVVYEGIEEDGTRLLKLRNDEIDMARILPVSEIGAVKDDDGLTPHVYPIPRSRYVVFDTDSEPFDDVRVRRAVLHAIDREELTETLLGSVTDPAVGPFPASVTDWANEALEPYEHDPDGAAELLADAGWTAEEGDTLGRDGTPFEIELWTYSTRPMLPRIAEVIQAQLGAVGIDVAVRTMESSTITERAESGPFDAFVWSNSLLWYPDPDRLTDFFHSEDSEMHSGYAEPRVDELLEAGRETVDPDRRKELYDELQSIVHEDLPIAFLTDYTNVVATRERVENYTPHPLESRYGLENVRI
ncbi:MAG: ABC transporter substrate-binding protein [Halalkalicoccus sp.]